MSNIADNREAEGRGFARGIEAAAVLMETGRTYVNGLTMNKFAASIRALQDREEPHE